MSTSQKLQMKNKTFQILEIDTFRPVSVMVISETVNNRRNLSTFYRNFQHNPLNNNKKPTNITIGWKINILYIFQICEIWNFGPLVDPFSK